MRLVIVGTGTNIGKTHLGVALVTALARRGAQVCGLKPIESGVEAGEPGADARALADASLFHVKQPPPYALPEPVSPHLAARLAGLIVDLPTVAAWIDSHPADWVLVETAGALLSPVSPTATNLDVAAALNPDAWLLVAADRLGVLHDVAACVLALRTLLSPAVTPTVVLQTPLEADRSSGTNAAELQLLGIAPLVYTMPRGAPTSEHCQSVAESIIGALR